MSVRVIALALLLSAPAAASAQAAAKANDPHGDGHVIIATPGAINFGPAPAILPQGAKLAVLEGNPMEAGPFVMRLWMPANYRIPAHFHPADEHVTVVSGTFYVGLGGTFDASKATQLPTGTFASLSRGKQHYALTKEVTVIQLHGVGPWSLTYVNPADDPSKKQ